MNPTEQNIVLHITPFTEQQKETTVRVFVLFFHPETSVTAMGGAEKRTVEVLKRFSRTADIEISALESGPSYLREAGIRGRQRTLSSAFHPTGWMGTYLQWLIWMARSVPRSVIIAQCAKPNVIFVPNNTLPNLVSGVVLGLILKRPLCVVVHHIDLLPPTATSQDCSFYANYRKARYGRLVSFAKTLAFYTSLPLLKTATAVIAVSNFTAKTLKSYGVNKPRISVSGNALDLNVINTAEQYSSDEFDAVFVGRIGREKGIFDLLKVWKNVVKAKKNARLLIIGSGLELPLLKERIIALSLQNRVFIRDRCEEKELYALLKSGKVFLFPSLFEGWGIAVAEALACGLPVVAYDIPALREVFGTCESVFLVPVKDVERMSSTVLDILNTRERERRNLSKDSRTYATRFSWERVAQQDWEALKSALR